MSKTDWFRRTTWTDADRESFNARLKRCRSAENKAQYLRIQAVCLAEAGQHAAAIELFDRLLREFPDSMEIALAHAERAGLFAKLGKTDDAIAAYRAALQREPERPNVRTGSWLNFGWFVVTRQLTGLYDEAARVLDEFRDEAAFIFPIGEYRYAAIQALLAAARGDQTQAREYAEQALFESAKTHSGLRYHPTLGLVGSKHSTMDERLKELIHK